LSTNRNIRARIKEFQTAVAERVVACEVRKRSWRVQQLQNIIDRSLATIEARAVMYHDQMGEGRTLQVVDLAGETAAIADGFAADPNGDSGYPKTMIHPGYPTGAAHGLLVKDYRGKDANQEIWKFDAALVTQICNALKQAAIEEGQWSAKRDQGPNRGEVVPARVTVVFVTPPGRDETGRIIDVPKS
jgi:hypothetical protein